MPSALHTFNSTISLWGRCYCSYLTAEETGDQRQLRDITLCGQNVCARADMLQCLPWRRSGWGWVLRQWAGLLSTSPEDTDLSKDNFIKTVSMYCGRIRPTSQFQYQFSWHIVDLNWETRDINKCSRKESKMTRTLFRGKRRKLFLFKKGLWMQGSRDGESLHV